MPITAGECKNGATSKHMSDYVDDIKNVVDYFNNNFYPSPEASSYNKIELPRHLAIYEELSGTYPVCMLAGTNRTILFGIKGVDIDVTENEDGTLNSLYFRNKNASCRCFGIGIDPSQEMDVDEAFSVAFGDADKSVHLHSGGSSVGSIDIAKNAFKEYTFYYANGLKCDCLIDLYQDGDGYYQSGVSSGSGDWIIGALSVKFNPSISNASALSSLQYSSKAWGNVQWLRNIKATPSKCVDDEWLVYNSGGGTEDPFTFSGNAISLGDFVYTTYPRQEDLSVLNTALNNAHSASKNLLQHKIPYKSVVSYQDIQEGKFKYSYIENVTVDLKTGIRINFTPVESFSQTTCICGIIGDNGFVLNELKASKSVLDTVKNLSNDADDFCEEVLPIGFEECGNPELLAEYTRKLEAYSACWNSMGAFRGNYQHEALFTCNGLIQDKMYSSKKTSIAYKQECCFDSNYEGQGPGFCIEEYTYEDIISVSARLGANLGEQGCMPGAVTVSASIGGRSLPPKVIQGGCATYEGVSIPFTAKDKDIIKVQLSVHGIATDFHIGCGGCEMGDTSYQAIVCDKRVNCGISCPDSQFDPICGKYCLSTNVPYIEVSGDSGVIESSVETDNLSIGNTILVQSTCLCK